MKVMIMNAFVKDFIKDNQNKKIKFAIIEQKTASLLRKYKINIPKNSLIFSNKNEKILNFVPPFSYKENW